MKKVFRFITTIFLVGLLSFSCNIGLGEALDITPPEVKIITPLISQSVAQQFIITGQAKDDYGITLININIDGDNFSEQYKYDGISWYRYQDDQWNTYDSAFCTGSEKQIDFSITVDGSCAVSGHEYIITTKVETPVKYKLIIKRFVGVLKIKSIALSGRNLSLIYLADRSTAAFIASSVIFTL